MNKKKVFGLVATAVLASAALTTVFLGVPTDNPGGILNDGGDQIASDANTTPSADESATDPVAGDSDASQESIQVHGNWTIEVQQPDGTFVSSYQFHNDLTPTGSEILANILARNATPARWQVGLSPFGEGPPPSPFTYTEGGDDAPGWLFEEDYDFDQFNHFKTLTVSVPESGDNAGKLVLSGTATAAQDGMIGLVTTKLSSVDPDVAPADASYTGAIGNSFTWMELETPVTVNAGQVILVTVVIDFS